MEFPGFKTLLKNTIDIYKKNLGLFAKLMAISFGLLIGIALIGIIIGVALIFLLSALNVPGLVITAIQILIFISALVAIIYTQSIVQIGFFKAAAGVGTIPSIKQWLMENKPFVWGFWVVGFLVGFITLGGLWLLIIPSIILGVWFTFSQYVYVFEKSRGMDALLKSREYVRGVGGVVFLNLLLLQIVMALIVGIPTFIFDSLDLQALSSIYTFILQIVMTPVGVIFSYQMYKHLKAAKPSLPDTYSRARKNKYLLIGFISPIVVIILVATGIWAYTSFMSRMMEAVPEMPTELETSYEESISFSANSLDSRY